MAAKKTRKKRKRAKVKLKEVPVIKEIEEYVKDRVKRRRKKGGL